jgi:hypothetical protein
MRSRALSLAAVAILVGLIGSFDARAENLEAGKSPQKIFNDTCTACHKSSRGLLKTVPANSLPGFLRQHYTTSADMASALSAYLLGGGGATEHVAEPAPKGKRDAKQEAKQEGAKPEGAKPESSKPEGAKDGASATAQSGAEPGAQGKRGKQAARTDADGRPVEAGPDGAKQSAKGKRGKKGAPAEETAKQEPAKDAGKDQSRPTDGAQAKTEPAKTEPAKTEPAASEPPKSDAAKPDEAKPATASTEPAATSAPDKSTSAPADATAPADVKAKEAALPPPAAPTSNPRPRKPMLTLPGFPQPVAEPDDASAATPAAATAAPATAAEPAKSEEPKTAAPAADQPKAEPLKTESPKADAPQSDTTKSDATRTDAPKTAAPAEPAKEQTNSQSVEPVKPGQAKSAADQPAESPAESPKLDIIEEESHGPGQAAPPRGAGAPKKKRATTSER